MGRILTLSLIGLARRVPLWLGLGLQLGLGLGLGLGLRLGLRLGLGLGLGSGLGLGKLEHASVPTQTHAPLPVSQPGETTKDASGAVPALSMEG